MKVKKGPGLAATTRGANKRSSTKYAYNTDGQALSTLPQRSRDLPAAGPVTATLLSRADLQALGIRYSNPHLLQLEREGKFPKRLTLSPAKVAWLRSEVVAWIELKTSERDHPGG